MGFLDIEKSLTGFPVLLVRTETFEILGVNEYFFNYTGISPYLLKSYN